MVEFRTIVSVPNQGGRLSHRHKIMVLGSCFAENIGTRMQNFRYQLDLNPFGVIYNPISVSNSLKMLLDPQEFTQENIHYANERWFSFYHHSKFSYGDPGECLHSINKSLMESAAFLEEVDYLMITFGSAYVFQLKETGEIVSNCHKVPSAKFNHILVKQDEIVAEYDGLITDLKALRPNLKIIFTVSPIRHMRDGLVGNHLSKSTLVVAIHELMERFDNVFYFPSYEILMDDLRDYRFYEDDMVHPSKVAIDYIWEKFTKAWIDDTSVRISEEIQRLTNACNHRAFNPDSEAYRNFMAMHLIKAKSLQDQFPYIDLSNEISYFSQH